MTLRSLPWRSSESREPRQSLLLSMTMEMAVLQAASGRAPRPVALLWGR